MKRLLGSLGALLLVAAFDGCAMCQSPFDYCGPVIQENGCPNCQFNARRGSIFAPQEGTPELASNMPTPAAAGERPETVPGETTAEEIPPGETGDVFDR